MRHRYWRAPRIPPRPTRRPWKRPNGSCRNMADVRIEPLAAHHDRSGFSCGKAPLDTFIRRHAAGNAERGVSRVYVAVRDAESRILAYYASSAGSFLRDHLPPDDQ